MISLLDGSSALKFKKLNIITIKLQGDQSPLTTPYVIDVERILSVADQILYLLLTYLLIEISTFSWFFTTLDWLH